MSDIFDSKGRRGHQGRIPDSLRGQTKLFQKINVSIEPSVFERLERYCEDEERARSWCITKALDYWLESKGY